MNHQQRHHRLQQRAELMARLRTFFRDRGFLEVETPLLDQEIIPELHIEPFKVASDSSRELTARRSSAPDATTASYWLQASPELHMKRLLAEGLPAIYQVTRSFRRGERGPLHNPEFTLVEWYRAGDRMEQGIDLLDELCQRVVQWRPAARTTYAEAFQQHAGLDPHRASLDELAAAARRLDVTTPEGLDHAQRDEWLNLLLAMAVEPHLGAAGPEILYHYPAAQSALAATTVDARGNEVAERFELYYRGIELANGYHELTDAHALRQRLAAVNEQRAALDRPALPLPESLLAVMERPGLPPCSGCALGFDRLAMLACGTATIDEVMTFASHLV